MYKKSGNKESYFYYLKELNKTGINKIPLSILSLLIVSAILITVGTVCWYSIKEATAESNLFEFEASKGLRVNDSGVDKFSFDNNSSFYLVPASSVDGRNIFFPTDGTDFSDITNKITYRSANAGDKNFGYIQIDFKLTAQSNNTAIYIDTDKTSLKVKDSSNIFTAQAAAPLRLAIYSDNPVANSGAPATPVVFNSQTKTIHTAAVSEVDRGSGEYISNGPQVACQFSDYAVGGKPITTLKAGKETLFSVIIWLEGCDTKCTYTKVNKNDIELKLAFKTSWDDTEVVRFKDESGYIPVVSPSGNPAEHNYYEFVKNNYILTGDTSVNNSKTYYIYTQGWIENLIKNYNYKLNLRYTKSTDSTETSAFNMYKYNGSENEWSATIPSDMKNKVEFILSPPTDSTEGLTYTFCKSDGIDGQSAGNDNTYDRGVNCLYIVRTAFENMHGAGETSDSTACWGHWTALGDSDGGGLDVGDLDGDDF